MGGTVDADRLPDKSAGRAGGCEKRFIALVQGVVSRRGARQSVKQSNAIEL
jgi:hypothetical protein